MKYNDPITLLRLLKLSGILTQLIISKFPTQVVVINRRKKNKKMYGELKRKIELKVITIISWENYSIGTLEPSLQ